MKLSMLVVTGLLATMSQTGMAAADCEAYPKEEWASEETLKEALEAEGYVIKKWGCPR